MSSILKSPAGSAALLSALLGAGAALADDVPLLADHIVPIEVRQIQPGDINTIFVDVTVCDAAQACRTVPNVIVDTGSTGLHLYREALDGLELDAVTTSDGRPLSHWTGFGSRTIWTTVNRAQVRIGKVSTDVIPIALYDKPSPLEQLPAAYTKVDSRDWFVGIANGVLGISPRRQLAEGYFVDRHEGGAEAAPDWHEVVVDTSRQLANPIAHFPAPYDNGSVIKLLGAGPGAAYAKLPGWLGLGIGLPTYGLFPASARVVSHELDQDGHFPLMVGERRFDVLLDSATNMLALDLDHLGIPRRGDGGWYYDAPAATPLELTALCGKRKVKLAQAVYVGARDSIFLKPQGYAVLPSLIVTPELTGGVSTLGSPFFYGRTVATGLQGSINPFLQQAPAAGLYGSVACDEALEPGSPSPYGYVVYTDGAD